MNPDVNTLNKMAGGIVRQIENDFPALDDAQKRCLLEIAAKTYDAKLYRDSTLASIAMMMRGT